ncbi:MAG TPA: isochorismatase family cysteine hydrolase [bacterium]|nr:isochorismatase family cysteine hydrolase [bacterium]
MPKQVFLLLVVALLGCASDPRKSLTPADPIPVDPRARPLTADLFQNAVLISVDIQNSKPGPPVTEETMDKAWASWGFTPQDVNAANEFFFTSALPNAAKVVRYFHKRKLPVILIRWGCRFKDGMDLDPEVRSTLQIKQNGTSEGMVPLEDDPGSQVHPALDPQPDDYILPKTAQDAFTSSNIGFVLENLRAKNLFLMGGHTGACLGKTSKSAKERGYTILCIEDATFDATESRRIPNLNAVGYDYIYTTEQVLSLE